MTRGLGKDTGRTGHYVRPKTHEESTYFFFFLKLSLRRKKMSEKEKTEGVLLFTETDAK